MPTLKATWHPILHLPSLPRSSQTLTTLRSSLHLFSGQATPRVPLGSELHVLPLNPEVPIAITILASPFGPPPRVGAASTSINDTLYVFGGCGGPDMQPLEEGGRIWSFETGAQAWKPLDPADESAPFPEARGEHGATAAGGKVYIHAGNPGSGEQLNDLWAFDIAGRQWERLRDAPGVLKGWSSIAVVGGREVWRFGGGEDGVIDVYDIPSNSWRSIHYDLERGPAVRSASCLVCVTHPNGREYLVTAFGERSPSTSGSGGVLNFLDDVWAYDVNAAEWVEVTVEGEKPQARGWFAADGVLIGEKVLGMVVQGGLKDRDTALGDWWILMFDMA